ncbi:hypothetical protein PG999_010366 [Apiospora kogelbergensis]|uniref:Xylanolytic transcriptional activator regulatory domain-containing protein n=1 Tax=Apiospora kogelbergensis TaxID=1337665 RepID=A0AAW0QBF6_9PEZI
MAKKTEPPSLSAPSDPTATPVGSGSTLNTPEGGHSECGSMHISATELSYVGSNHWAAIADSIADLRDYVDRGDHLRPVDNHEDASGGETMAARHPRGRLALCSSVHGPTFLQEYETFWANPTDTSVVWLGLLFGMICLAAITSGSSDLDHVGNAERAVDQVSVYREKVAQCLIRGEYTKCGPYVLETLVHYLYIEFLLSPDADQDLWFLLGLEVNTALRMGYHREPCHFTALTPLQREMRRRVWATVLLSDILLSSQMGMPRMVTESQCDTAEPRNLNDADLDAHTTEAPQSRPETEYTTSTGIIARRRLLVVVGKISDLTSGVRACTYDEVKRLDQALGQAANTIPQPLRMKPVTASITDSPEVIMARIFLRHLFYKGQLLLHQRFLHLKSSSDEYSFALSRKACLDASLGSLQLQKTLDEETRPGGQLDTLRWRVTSIMNHQFLTATMILCSLIYRNKSLQSRDTIVPALRAARDIWTRRNATSNEAQRATDTISFVLEEVGEIHDSAAHTPASPSSFITNNDKLSDSINEQNTMLDASMGFSSSTTGNIIPPFWGACITNPLQEDAFLGMDMELTGPGGQALHDWMAINWPNSTT